MKLLIVAGPRVVAAIRNGSHPDIMAVQPGSSLGGFHADVVLVDSTLFDNAYEKERPHLYKWYDEQLLLKVKDPDRLFWI